MFPPLSSVYDRIVLLHLHCRLGFLARCGWHPLSGLSLSLYAHWKSSMNQLRASSVSLPHSSVVPVSSILIVAENHTWYFSSNELISYSKTNFGEQHSGEISALSEVFSTNFFFFLSARESTYRMKTVLFGKCTVQLIRSVRQFRFGFVRQSWKMALIFCFFHIVLF